MIITLERPDTAPAALHVAAPTACPQGLRWCTGDPDTHDLDELHEDESIYHDSAAVDLPLTAGADLGSNGFTVSIERKDALDGTPGRVRLYLATTRDRVPRRDGGYATLEEADRIAREIRAHVVAVRSATKLGPAAIAALARLSARQQIAMRLRYVYGNSLSEIGHVMGVSPDRVRVYLSRAKEQLHEWGVLDTAATLGGAA